VRTWFAARGQRRLCWNCYIAWVSKIHRFQEEIPVKKPREWDWYNIFFLVAVVMAILSLLSSSCNFHF
jgi:hypothetical protein